MVYNKLREIRLCVIFFYGAEKRTLPMGGRTLGGRDLETSFAIFVSVSYFQLREIRKSVCRSRLIYSAVLLRSLRFAKLRLRLRSAQDDMLGVCMCKSLRKNGRFAPTLCYGQSFHRKLWTSKQTTCHPERRKQLSVVFVVETDVRRSTATAVGIWKQILLSLSA